MAELQWGSTLNKGYISRLEKLMKQQEEDLEEQQRKDFQKQALESQKKKEKSGDDRSLASKAFDTVNLIDGGRSWTTKDSDNGKDAAEQIGDIGRGFLGNTTKLANTVAEGGRRGVELGRALTARATGNEEAERAAIERGLSEEESLLSEGRGLLGTGGVITNEEAEDLDADTLARKSVGAGLGVAGEVLPGSAGLKGASAASKAARAGAEGAGLGAAGELGNQVLDDEAGINLGSVAQGAGFGAVTGAAGDLAGSAIARRRGGTPNSQVDEMRAVDEDAAAIADDLDAEEALSRAAYQTGLSRADDMEAGLNLGNNDLSRALPAGFRPIQDIEAEIQALQNGDYSSIATTSSTPAASSVDPEAIATESRQLTRDRRDLYQQLRQTDPEDPVSATLTNRLAQIDTRLEELNAEVNSGFTGGTPGSQTNVDTAAVKQRFSELQNELAQAQEYEAGINNYNTSAADARSTYENTSGRTPESIQADIDRFEAGEVPGAAMIRENSPETLDDILLSPNLPEDLKAPADSLRTRELELQNIRNTLVDAEVRDVELAGLDTEYFDRMAMIEQMPPARQEVEAQRLEEEYATRMDEIEANFEKDAEMVAGTDQALMEIQNESAKLIADADIVMNQAPDQFMDFDRNEVIAQRDNLDRELEMANQQTTSSGVTDTVMKAPNPERYADDNPQVYPEVRTEVAKALDDTPAKNLGGVRQHMLSLLSPSRILETMGERELHTNIFKAFKSMNDKMSADVDKIATISNALKDNGALGDQIVDFLEGKRQTISAADQEVADLIQDFLAEKRVGLQEAGFKTMDDYFPHMFDGRSQLAKSMFADKATGKVSFGNLKQRKANADDYSRDITDVLMRYAQSYHKKMELEPALLPLQNLKTRNGITEAEANWLDEYTQQVKGLDSGDLEKKFDRVLSSVTGKDMGGSYRKAFGAQRMLSAVATMGLNPATAIRNTTQMINSVADLGPKFSLVGSMRGTRALMSGKDNADWKEMMDAGIFDGGLGKNANLELEEATGGVSKKNQVANKASNALMSMIRVSDIALRSQAYWGAKALAESKGMTGQAAKDFALEKVIDTQFMTNKIDMPTALNGPGVRSLTQLASFSAKQTEFLERLGVRLVKGEDGRSRIKDGANVFAGALTAWAATEMLKPMIGFNEKEFVPFYDQIASVVPGLDTESDGIYRSPFVRLIAGDGKGKDGILQFVQSLSDEDDDKSVAEKFNKLWDDNWSQLVPGGTQLKKTTEGDESSRTGVSKNKNGQVRFLQDMDGWSDIQTRLFGQYSTDAGRKWLEEGMPTLSKSEMQLNDKDRGINFMDLPRETQEKYYDFFTTAKQITGRQEAVDKMKEYARAGNDNAVARVAQEYNAGANEVLSRYWERQSDLPEALMDQMFNDILITDPGKVSDSANRLPSSNRTKTWDRYNDQDLR